ncbi:MAG: glycosyltransferase family 4 protein [Acidobacteria bacterium]|nr:glycosyltransferase family 4 protein [Acidobacteriota bacterium]
MNVLLLSTDFPPLLGGISTYSKNIARHLSGCCRVEVVAPCFGKRGERPALDGGSYRLSRAVDIAFLRELHIGWLCLKALARRNGKTVILATTWFPTGFLAHALWRLFDYPYYVAAHASEFLDDRRSWRRAVKYYLRFLKQPVFGHAVGVFAVSHYTAGLLRDQGVKASRIHVVPNGADPAVFHPREITGDLRRDYQVESRRVLLTVCRLDPHKGVGLVLQAVRHLLCEFPDLLYVVIGTGPEYAPLQAEAEILGIREHVRFLGNLPEPEVAVWYNLCEVYAMPSHEIPGRRDLVEGFGISFVEAAASGRPAVACRFGGATDAVLHEQTGLLIDAPPRVEEIVEALSRLLRSRELRERLGNAALARAQQELNWEQVASQMLAIFQHDLCPRA